MKEAQFLKRRFGMTSVPKHCKQLSQLRHYNASVSVNIETQLFLKPKELGNMKLEHQRKKCYFKLQTFS